LVLGIAGSPRRGGNTETILDEVLRGAAEAGGARVGCYMVLSTLSSSVKRVNRCK
jgi:multimeric flavodoxin WrbA